MSRVFYDRIHVACAIREFACTFYRNQFSFQPGQVLYGERIGARVTTEKGATDVNLDFHVDFRRIVEMVLTRNDIAVDPDESYNDAVYRFYANARRRVDARHYRILEAEGLACPADLLAGYDQLKFELEHGVDVTDRLSRKTSKAKYEDGMLNDWGITHFHLGLRGAPRNDLGTKIVLFALVRDDVVHCIGFFDHGSWYDREVLEIAQRNWPHLLEHARIKAVALSSNYTDSERAQLRAAGILVFSSVNGNVYAPIGGGYTSARTSMTAHKQADRAILSVAAYEKHVRDNVSAILKDFEAAGCAVSNPPTFHFGFHADGRAIATEPTTPASIILGHFPL